MEQLKSREPAERKASGRWTRALCAVKSTYSETRAAASVAGTTRPRRQPRIMTDPLRHWVVGTARCNDEVVCAWRRLAEGEGRDVGSTREIEELAPLNPRLSVRGSVALGAHPRYTAPLGPDGLIYSASRDDGSAQSRGDARRGTVHRWQAGWRRRVAAAAKAVRASAMMAAARDGGRDA